MGQSTRTDMLRVFGQPQGSVPAKGEETEDKTNPEAWYYYEEIGDLPGTLVVAVDKETGVISSIEIRPRSLSKDEAIRHFGHSYIITNYDADECLGDGEASPLYESPNGASTFVEYRDRGIAISINYQSVVNYILYTSKPIGALRSRCPDEKGYSER